MRKLVLLTVVLLLAAPAVAWGLRGAPGDGSLVVEDGRGVVALNARGGIIGRFDQGQLLVQDPPEAGGIGPIVFGAERVRDIGLTRTLYIGEDIRFRLIGGTYRVRISAVGMDISAVGRGFAILDDGEPIGFSDPGRYSVNGGPFQAMPSSPTRVSLGTPPPGVGPGGGGPGK
jgi:hypothetical protein